MKIGEKFLVKTESVYCEEKKPNTRKPQVGKVVYVHPRGRFAVLELPGGLRESYCPEQLSDRNRVSERNECFA